MFSVGDLIFRSNFSILLYLDESMNEVSDIWMFGNKTVGIVLDVIKNKSFNTFIGENKGMEIVKILIDGGRVGWGYSIYFNKIE